jgi:crossover junction endodeoxyribonuclease RusA
MGVKRITFMVEGIAQPAGSKKAFPMYKGSRKWGKLAPPQFTGHVSVVDANPKNKKWQAVVKISAMQFYTGKPLDGPLVVSFSFYLPRPKSHTYTDGRLKSDAPAYPTVKPDVLKLSRAIEDALTGICYNDDSQIVTEVLMKRYTTAQPFVHVDIQSQTIEGSVCTTPL